MPWAWVGPPTTNRSPAIANPGSTSFTPPIETSAPPERIPSAIARAMAAVFPYIDS